VVSALVDQGLSSGTANWLATNLEKGDDGYVWLLDADKIEELLADYFSVDLWSVLTNKAVDKPKFELVIADQSDRWSGAMRQRAAELAKSGRATLHVVPNSGHWLHVDNPDYLIRLLVERLPRE
jgi:pimeloyl-ACP methyl ester carboxylesterase